jgi:protein-ribulosamine 3-kinase
VDWRDAVREACAAPRSASLHVVAHGHWSESWLLRDGARRWLVKTAVPQYAPLLDSEAEGLAGLCETSTVRVPDVVARGSGWLVLEWLDLRPLEAGAVAKLGAALAQLHLAPAGKSYGWAHDNFIGGMPQQNGWHEHWIDFWRERRLGPQLQRAAQNGYRGSLQRDGERLIGALDDLLADHPVRPALLHGDLWGGNAGALADGTPVIFDPAVYIGDREADLAMTDLFGGFGPGFHAAYRDACPVDEGFETRRDLYNLYHLLNHLNLFGSSYLARCERVIGTLLSR